MSEMSGSYEYVDDQARLFTRTKWAAHGWDFALACCIAAIIAIPVIAGGFSVSVIFGMAIAATAAVISKFKSDEAWAETDILLYSIAEQQEARRFAVELEKANARLMDKEMELEKKLIEKEAKIYDRQHAGHNHYPTGPSLTNTKNSYTANNQQNPHNQPNNWPNNQHNQPNGRQHNYYSATRYDDNRYDDKRYDDKRHAQHSSPNQTKRKQRSSNNAINRTTQQHITKTEPNNWQTRVAQRENPAPNSGRGH